jgi:hypothetical protein
MHHHHLGLIIVSAILLVLTCPANRRSSVFGYQPPEHKNAAHCGDCHACTTPTAAEPCLKRCARQVETQVEKAFAPGEGPDVVILGELSELYLPVPFDHRGHAAMSQMAGGCGACHHYTQEDAKHPACKTCHAIDAGGDIRKPGLKGAYHRQCISCHREWSGETSCSICHLPKAAAGVSPKRMPTPDDLIGQMHPPIPEPDSEIYVTVREGYPSSKVVFRHKEHIHDYDLRCSDCHREDNCTRCHAGTEHVQRVRTLDEHHKPCFDCHKDDACEKCHFEEGKSQPPPFDHATTGFTLSRYHKSASCRDCHQAAPYVALDANCNKCHTDWSSETFVHAVTGQGLDERHAAADCDDCHQGRNFAVAPVCSGCHEEEEGIAFPAKRPGPQTNPVTGSAAGITAGEETVAHPQGSK